MDITHIQVLWHYPLWRVERSPETNWFEQYLPEHHFPDHELWVWCPSPLRPECHHYWEISVKHSLQRVCCVISWSAVWYPDPRGWTCTQSTISRCLDGAATSSCTPSLRDLDSIPSQTQIPARSMGLSPWMRQEEITHILTTSVRLCNQISQLQPFKKNLWLSGDLGILELRIGLLNLSAFFSAARW